MKHEIKNSKIISRKYQGSALAYVLIIMTIVSIIVSSMLYYIVSQLRFSQNRADSEQAFQIAESGIYWYRWYLAYETSGKTVQQIASFWQTGHPLGVASDYITNWNDPGGGTIGQYDIHVQAPDPSSTIVMVTSTGWTNAMPNVKSTIQVRFRRPSWSEYSVLANDDMRFGAGTVVYGKIQSNEGIRFDGVAHNMVSSSLASYQDPDHSGGPEFGVHTHINPPPQTGENDNYRPSEAPPNAVPSRPDVFMAGRQFPVPTVDFNGVVSNLGYMKTQAQSSGKYFNNTAGGVRIILNNNGTFNACVVNQYDNNLYSISQYQYLDSHGNVKTCGTCSGSCMQTYAIPNNGVIYVENNAWVEGVINGQKVTIVAANLIGGAAPDIYLGINNLTYTNFNGNDIIGLIAQNNVSVVANSQNFLTIDGALLAQSGRVGRNDYPATYNKNTITVNGSIATNIRYGFAHTDGTGYTNRILNFDNNLLYYPPPYFPTGTQYSIDLWQEM